jgi:signal transduction histidine kinase
VDLREQLRTIAELQQQAQTLQANLIQRLQSEERLHRLQEITGQLSQSLEANQVLASIARSAADLLVVPVGAVFLLERGRPDGDFVLAAAYGIDEQQALNLRLPRWASLAGRAVDSGQTLVVDDARTTPGTALPALLTGETTGSEIAAPIRSGAKTFGVIKAFCATVRRFQPNDAALLTTLAAAAAVALTNAELYREAQDAIRLRDEFLSATTHDLRTPLTSVKGTAQLMRRRLTRNGQPVPDWLLEGLVSIDTTATQMGEELDDLLDVTRLQLGQPLELHRSPIDGIQLVRQVVAAQLRLSPRHQLRVETALAELIGEWDGVRLRRVLDNLLSNAIKYSPAGGPVLVTVAREQIDGGAYAVLAVQDHGVGIPAADLSHIFERFHRASNVQGRISGTGIGLASARQIVEQHGGDLTVRSTEGQGSVFTVLLPLAPTPAELRPAGQA